MGITERRSRERIERKALIINCAKDLILEYGVAKVSMMDIAQRAELSKATLYLYFPGKDALFQEICSQVGRRFLEYFKARSAGGLSAVETLRLFWSCYLELFGESDDMVLLFSMKQYLAPEHPFISIDKNSDSPIGSEYEFYSLLSGLISRGIAEGSFDPYISPDVFARALLSLFSLIVENAARLPKKTRRSQVIIEEMKTLFRILFRGIAREGASPSELVLT
ncbi:MAG: TetR/AcrR family transcriptional regulator [Spirochaetaceae bacterium]|jgi:AcrR family transcriptional regulator|nr:TetR/AcrR family transcriptional regulator [Spirochaetaceae bacterium]